MSEEQAKEIIDALGRIEKLLSRLVEKVDMGDVESAVYRAVSEAMPYGSEIKDAIFSGIKEAHER